MSDACEFQQEQPHEWRCITHGTLSIGSRSEPVACALGIEQEDFALAQIEKTIEKHRPSASEAPLPASGGQLRQINRASLIAELVEAQVRALEAVYGPIIQPADVIVTRQTAWEVMAVAQRRGVRFGGETGADHLAAYLEDGPK